MSGSGDLTVSPASPAGISILAVPDRYSCAPSIVRRPNIFGADLSERAFEPYAFARRMQDRESDTGYDTRRRVLDGIFARVSQTAVYDTY